MWLGPLSTPIAPLVAAMRSMSASRSIAGQTSAASPSAAAMRAARACSSAPDCGRATVPPAATMRRPSSIQCASGQSLSARELPWTKTTRDRAARGACRPEPERRRRCRVGRMSGASHSGQASQHPRDELARAIERMAVRLDADRVRHQPARRPLVARTLGAIGQAVARPVRQPRDDRRLGQALQVDDRVVALAAQPAQECARLGRAAGAQPARFRPAPQRQLDHLADPRHPPQQRRERRLDDPVDRPPADRRRGCRPRPAAHARRRRATTA